MNIMLTDSAAKRVLALRAKENKPNLMLRVTVLGGGCSGFQYELSLDDKLSGDDVTFDHDNGATLVTDETSLPFLNGSNIDFVSTMMKSEFKIHNPNAASGCGCGASFAVKQ